MWWTSVCSYKATTVSVASSVVVVIGSTLLRDDIAGISKHHPVYLAAAVWQHHDCIQCIAAA